MNCLISLILKQLYQYGHEAIQYHTIFIFIPFN
jgi:hypothetical protein